MLLWVMGVGFENTCTVSGSEIRTQDQSKISFFDYVFDENQEN